jgi:hypothetical protein
LFRNVTTHHHVQNHVAKSVPFVRIGVVVYEQIVGALIVAAGGPGQRKFPQVGESFVVGVFRWFHPLLVSGQEETSCTKYFSLRNLVKNQSRCTNRSLRDVGASFHQILHQLAVVVGDGQV